MLNVKMVRVWNGSIIISPHSDHADHVMIEFMILGIWMRCRNACISLRKRSTNLRNQIMEDVLCPSWVSVSSEVPCLFLIEPIH